MVAKSSRQIIEPAAAEVLIRALTSPSTKEFSRLLYMPGIFLTIARTNPDTDQKIRKVPAIPRIS